MGAAELVAAGAVVAGVVDVGVAVCVVVGCGVARDCVVCGVRAAGVAGCSVAGWLAKLRLREPAFAWVATSATAAISMSLRMEAPVIWSIHLT
ncbi:hypothetical protein [Bradyrhizobium sp. Cp5.3]|uniref:hypothetical protein n=1 Tax=Bradyrhizobium sp. Cp5.3 TaxID=443598 RepID=UPI0018DC95C2|nr:hypothetical protein [Bradyrhizobium sp. Cp5.3]